MRARARRGRDAHETRRRQVCAAFLEPAVVGTLPADDVQQLADALREFLVRASARGARSARLWLDPPATAQRRCRDGLLVARKLHESDGGDTTFQAGRRAPQAGSAAR